ncbi:hypothetical protein F444_04312 [Phytophthora nicotianae P1976]|uniref:Uncharacterized protein n=1 Tax=Phytophthora nicotianae P1976 TaxID=1317066 RepID=A0A081AR56_PHYNI|nr:hypothetical protein F444_04312 [Phytophthora nicotianae P1976]
MARTHKTAHIKAAMAEKERLAKESRRDDIARVQDAHDGKREKSTENTSEERPGDAEAQEDEDENVAESTGVEAKNGSDSADVSEEDVAQIPVAEEPSGRQRSARFLGLVGALTFAAKFGIKGSQTRRYRSYLLKWSPISASFSVPTDGQSVTGLRMLAQVTKQRDRIWGIVVKREGYSHNHRVSEGIYRSYPGIRNVPDDPPLMPGIELLVEAKAGTASVYNYIRDNPNHQVTMKEVHNLLHRQRNQSKSV